MVGIVLVSHSHALAQAAREMVVAMAGPRLRIAIAAGAGDHHADLGTNAIEIMEAIHEVMSDDGVLVLMDLGSALLSTDTALGFLDEAQSARVRCSAAPFLEGAVAAGVVAAAGSTLDEVNCEALSGLRQKQEHLGPSVPAGQSDSSDRSDMSDSASQSIRIKLPNPHGLHARPAARFIREGAAFSSDIQVRNLTRHRGPVSARSLTGLASLEVLLGDEIEISASGPDAAAALQALKQSVESGLGDSLAEFIPAPQPVVPGGPPVPVSAGLAIGPLFFPANAETIVPGHLTDDPEGELLKLHEAIAAARISIQSDENALRKSLAKSDAEIFEAQALVLDDPSLLARAEASIREHGANAALAWAHAFQAIASDYDRIEDEYLRQRAADVRDIGARVLAALGVARPHVGDLPRPGILVVDDLAPAEAVALPSTVLGVICLQGGSTSHASILLRARGIPAIARAKAALDSQPAGILAAFDGSTGELWINPGPAKLQGLRARAEAERAAASESTHHSHEPAITTDGHPVPIFANLSSSADASAALDQGAEGVGLFRTEFLFLDRPAPPGEEEQFEALRRLREIMGVRPVIIRTLDIGGDKAASYPGLAAEANPFLGERGIRVCLARPELFQAHLRAILRAGLGGNFRIMFPMLSDLGEFRDARAALFQAHAALDQSRTPHAWPLPIGITVEVPSAVILGDQLAAEADFFSIGTNDLAQYILAADRGNPALSRFHDPFHPALLRAIAQIAAEAHRRHKPIGVCGEMASDPAAARLLIGLGIDHLSLSPARIPALKSAIRAARHFDLLALSQRALALESPSAVRAII